MKPSELTPQRFEEARQAVQKLTGRARTLCDLGVRVDESARILDAADDLLNIIAPHDPRGWDDFVRTAVMHLESSKDFLADDRPVVAKAG